MEKSGKRKISPASGIDIDGIVEESSIGDASDNIWGEWIFMEDNPNSYTQDAKTILEEINDDVFGLLLEGYSNAHMLVNLRYVDTSGIVKERELGCVNVMETSTLSLKSSIDSFFVEHGLSLKKVRGQSQSYNGESDMHDEFSGLKDLIMKENSSAYYVHNFADELKLVVVVVAETHIGVGNLFDMICILRNVVCVSCKQKDVILETQKKKVQEAIRFVKFETESEIREAICFHYNILSHMLQLFPCIVEVLEYIEKEGNTNSSQREANRLQIYLKSFDFVFNLHLMLHILGITHVLPQSLKGEGKDVLNAMSLVKSTKQSLQEFRDDGFDSLLKDISTFCEKHDIEMLNMEEDYVNPKNPKQKTNITYRQYYELDCFNVVMNKQIKELNDRFSEISSKLLIRTMALNPRDSFREFDRSKLLKLAKMYPDDFSCAEMRMLEHQLDFYINNVQEDKRFDKLDGIVDLSRVMVETKKHIVFPLVYRLLKLALVLPVETTSG